MEKVITQEYLHQKLELRKKHRDLSHIHGVKYEIESICGYFEELRQIGREENKWGEWSEFDLTDKINALNEVYSKLCKEEDELYEKYGLKPISNEEWKKAWNERKAK